MDDGKSEWWKKKEKLKQDKCRKGVVGLFGTLFYNSIRLKKIASALTYRYRCYVSKASKISAHKSEEYASK